MVGYEALLCSIENAGTVMATKTPVPELKNTTHLENMKNIMKESKQNSEDLIVVEPLPDPNLSTSSVVKNPILVGELADFTITSDLRIKWKPQIINCKRKC